MNIFKTVSTAFVLATTLVSVVHANSDSYLIKQHKQKLNQINKLWETLPQHLQVRWLDEQTAWNKNYQKVCAQEQQETDTLQCKINVITERITELKERYKAQGATLSERLMLANAVLASTVSSLPPEIAGNAEAVFRKKWRAELETKCGSDMVCALDAVEEKTEEFESFLALPS
ncbi:MAG: hypothetical protein Q4E77_07885 [Conchiformibius sp.]|nr:hypothetical protein [Conchiformibius sp.]